MPLGGVVALLVFLLLRAAAHDTAQAAERTLGFLSRNTTAGAAGVNSSQLPLMDTVNIYHMMMCWGRLKDAPEGDPCRSWMVEHCQVQVTGEGYCQKLRDLVVKECRAGKASACGRAVQLGALRGEVKDFAHSVWPSNMDPATDTVANAIDKFNDSWVRDLAATECEAFKAACKALPSERAKARVRIVSFSHFVPRLQLNPEKRFLFYPNINKAIGSKALEQRVAALRPDIHVFGHTHFGWDAVFGETRYIQAPLAMPKERSSFTVTVVGDFPDFDERKPLLLRDGCDWPETYQAGWSEYYKTFPREAHRTEAIQGRMMKLYKWKGPGPQPSEEICFKDRKPGWELAPQWVYQKLAVGAPGFGGPTHGMRLEAGHKS